MHCFITACPKTALRAILPVSLPIVDSFSTNNSSESLHPPAQVQRYRLLHLVMILACLKCYEWVARLKVGGTLKLKGGIEAGEKSL